jgi:hypothetical protein
LAQTTSAFSKFACVTAANEFSNNLLRLNLFY